MNQAVLSVFGNLNEIEVLFLTLCRQEEKRLCGEEHGRYMYVCDS